MSDLLDTLLIQLNATGLAKSDPRLYQVLKNLIGGTTQVKNSVAAVSSSGASGVTGSGTAGSISQWSATTALTDVNQAGISAALDLL